MALSLVLAGGGTGGHVYPALALADAVVKRSPSVEIRFMGTERGLEARVVPAAGYVLECVPARPVLGRGPLARVRALAALAHGAREARRLLRRARPDLVLGMGGYASVPSVVAALTLGIPVGLVEPNARPGRSNRWLGRFVRGVFVQFDEAVPYFPRGRALRTGIPVRAVASPPREREPGTRLLIFGGSQGARSLNRAVVASLDQLGERDGFRITHQTGPADFEEVRAAYHAAGVHAEVAPFFDDMMQRMVTADLVVARAGASTVAELCCAGAASLLVPYPFAADDHQLANARALETKGASRVVLDRDLARELAPTIRELTREPGQLARMGEQAERLAAPGAADRIWETCLGWLPAVPGDVGDVK